MERAKRLELDASIPQGVVTPLTSEKAGSGCSQIDAQAPDKRPDEAAEASHPCLLAALKSPDPLPLPVAHADLREIVSTWMELNPIIQSAILSIVRNAIPTRASNRCTTLPPSNNQSVST
jgi:hypothetical protein